MNWNIVGVPMVVTKWIPKTEKKTGGRCDSNVGTSEESTTSHVFVEGLSFITNAVGFPVRLHSETIACTNFEVDKVFVNVDHSKVLPKEIKFLKNGKEFVAEFHYPWLPSRCNLCDKWVM